MHTEGEKGRGFKLNRSSPKSSSGFQIKSPFEIGLGIAVAAFGLSYFVESFKGFKSDEIYAISLAILALGASLLLFGLGLAKLAVTVGVGTLGFLAGLAFAIGALGLAVGYLADNMVKLTQSFTSESLSGIKDFATALSQIGNEAITANVVKNITDIYSSISTGDAPTQEKIQALVDISSAVKTYSDATKTFSEGGGAAVASTLNETFVKMITEVSAKTTEIKTTSAAAGSSSSIANVNIYLGDELLVGDAFATIVEEQIRGLTATE